MAMDKMIAHQKAERGEVATEKQADPEAITVEEQNEVEQAEPEAQAQDAQEPPQSQPTPPTESTATKKFKVCAICCKEKALLDGNSSAELDQEIDDEKARMVEKLGRPLKLREQKAVERRVENARDREKQRAKDERRAARDEAERKKKGKGATSASPQEEKEEDSDSDDDEDALNQSNHDGGEDMTDEEDDESVADESESDDEDDPFLKAVGGKEKLLTGEAYQKMLVQREQMGKLTLGDN